MAYGRIVLSWTWFGAVQSRTCEADWPRRDRGCAGKVKEEAWSAGASKVERKARTNVDSIWAKWVVGGPEHGIDYPLLSGRAHLTRDPGWVFNFLNPL